MDSFFSEKVQTPVQRGRAKVSPRAYGYRAHIAAGVNHAPTPDGLAARFGIDLADWR